MKRRFLLSILCLSIGTFSAMAQNMLNIHQLSGAVVSYSFSEKPVVTYINNILRITTTNETLDFPLSELKMMDFTTSESSDGILKIASEDRIAHIFTIDGKLVTAIETDCPSSAINTAEFPAGIYIIKYNNTSFKYIKK